MQINKMVWLMYNKLFILKYLTDWLLCEIHITTNQRMELKSVVGVLISFPYL